MRHVTFALTGALLLAGGLHADPGKPVAVRFWGRGLVTIETYWDLRIAVDPYALRIGYDDPQIEADLVLVTHEHFDHNNVGLIGGAPRVLRGLDDAGDVVALDVVLDRMPDSPTVALFDASEPVTRSDHAVRVRSIGAFHDAEDGSQRGRTAMFLIEVDGVRILHCGDLGQPALSRAQLRAIGSVDVLLLPVGGVYTIDGPQAARITAQVQPRIVIPIHYRTEAQSLKLGGAEAFLEALPQRYERVTSTGNTLAVTAGLGPTRDAPRVVMLQTRPAAMPPEIAALLAAKESAAADSREVFRTLTKNQLNHRPGNGTHTPRWNAEHMMGMELRFFTAIYAAVDPSVGIVNLAPAQMPDEYAAAHPGWTGAEEARQLDRVQKLTRRFAYLLRELDLDEQPPGIPWSLRELLRQMQRHYVEHTDNVRKKFELPDWPPYSPER